MSRVRLAVLAALAALLLAPAAAAACTDDVQLTGFSDALDETTFAGTDVGGLSGLAVDPRRRDTLLALVDNQGTTRARVLSVRVREGAAPRVVRLTTLRRADGTPFTGADLDGEGIAVSPRGELLVASETEPSIRRFSRSGRLRGELEVPARFRVAPAGEATANATFESLTLTPDGRTLFTATEGPLSADASTPDGRSRIRILRYRLQGDTYVPDGQLQHLTEPGQSVVELAARSEDELLVLERGFVAGEGNTVRVFRAFTTGAPDVTGVAALGAADPPLSKELLVDLADCPPSGAQNPGPQRSPLLDNVEALTFAPESAQRTGRVSLVLASDDNFSARQVTRLYALRARLRPEPTLTGRAVLPARTFAPGPPSGAAITAANGVEPPFASQPIQGISGVLDAGDGSLWAMPDNGYGAKANSADFLLRVYRLTPRLRTAAGGPGDVAPDRPFVSLRDPDRRVPFAIVNEDTPERLLTGADFDVESLRRDPDGDLWFGEEFGPYVLHTDATGRLLEAPIPLAGVRSPDDAGRPGEPVTLPGSRGFEGMAISPDGATLFPMIEGALTTDPDQRRRRILELDRRSSAYTGREWQYRVDDPAHAIGDLTALDEHRLLVIERDNAQGAAARFKKVFVVDRRRTDAAGFLVKRQVLDLLRIRDPRDLAGTAEPFTFPFQTIESVLPVGRDELLVINDNNFPFSAGRTPGRPDDTEVITVQVPGLR
jgi:hypothetical protein